MENSVDLIFIYFNNFSTAFRLDKLTEEMEQVKLKVEDLYPSINFTYCESQCVYTTLKVFN